MFLKSTNNTIESYPYNTREDYPLTAFPPGADYPTFNIYWVHPTPQSPPPDHTATEGQPIYNNELNRWEQTWEYQEVIPPVVPDWDSFNAYMLSDAMFKSYRDTVRVVDGELNSALFDAYSLVDTKGTGAFSVVWTQWCVVSQITVLHKEDIANVAEGFNLPADFVAIVRGSTPWRRGFARATI